MRALHSVPDNVGDNTAAVLVLHSEVLQHGELGIRYGQQLPVVQYVRQRQLPSLRSQVSSIHFQPGIYLRKGTFDPSPL